MAKTLTDLRASSENPRTITPAQREALRKSYESYGDLSGIVFNTRTKNLVGGHQRVSLYRSDKTAKVISTPHKDDTGTIAIGTVKVRMANGATISIPYREVSWSGDKEAAANIAANSAGGEFDYVMLGKIVRRLEKHKFPIEEIPLDNMELRRAINLHDSLNKDRGSFKVQNDTKERFEEAAQTNMKFVEHTCARCSYSWKEPLTAVAVAAAPEKKKNNHKAEVAKKRNLRTLSAESKRIEKPVRRKVVKKK